MHEITINLDTLLSVAGIIVAVGGAAMYLKKGAIPVIRPFKKIKELDARTHSCDQKFANDQRQLLEMREDIKMVMKSQMLMMKHVETGNCTGEVAAGREELEHYLIDKD